MKRQIWLGGYYRNMNRAFESVSKLTNQTIDWGPANKAINLNLGN